MRSRVLPLLLPVLLLPTVLVAQWHVTVRSGMLGHSAQAEASAAADEPSFRPGSGLTLGGAIGLDRGPWRVALMVGRETPDLVLRSSDAGIATPNTFTALDLGVEVGHRIAGRPGAAALHLTGGVARTRWSFRGVGEPPRWTWRGLAALDGAIPLAGAIDGVLRLEGSREAGLFRAEELPDGYRAHGAWRTMLALGLRWRP